MEPRIKRLLDRRGLGDGDAEGSASDAWAEEAPVLAGWPRPLCKGPWRSGLSAALACVAWATRARKANTTAAEGCHARANGFDLHAGLVVPAGQRDRLERVCRYALRPPVAQERIHLTALLRICAVAGQGGAADPTRPLR